MCAILKLPCRSPRHVAQNPDAPDIIQYMLVSLVSLIFETPRYMSLHAY